MSTSPVILYVEDDFQSRVIMKVLLVEVMGFANVTILEDSHDFLKRLEALSPPPDVIFLDIHVPPFSGFEMLEMLRQHPSFAHIPVVAFTASVMSEEVLRLRTAGFSSVIAKPLDQDTFPETLNRILQGQEVWRINGV